MSSRPDIHHLRLSVKLAEEALLAGDDPFGSVLVDDATGAVLHQDRNRVTTGADATYHPEIELARWAQKNLSPEARRATTVYTSGEHCAMCTMAHAYCGLGRIIFVSSSEQYRAWRAEFGAPAARVAPLGIKDVAPDIVVEGPISGLDEEVKELQRRRLTGGK
ncbi:CMP/dCMP deaminase [Plectosphaerella cucumerina]|jgi:tRNA(Arg) A34 adenosine deaminase TadA|uniref:CMP/dCMP deaminase n=1 Tax=Plectosphaerella cucumerina TaxID=40658 RepID=A0A8K0TED5_9PEZI|nr:CMP/dCMP deaminase [Plectosphaerella cucumerina]